MTDENVTPIIQGVTECESCLMADEHTPATTRSTNPEWSGYALCEECAEEYNSREPVIAAGATTV